MKYVSLLCWLLVTPVLGADFKSFEELKWVINANVIGGVEWSREGSTRRFRFLLNYYHGFNPYGQFFAQKIETFGFGLYLAFWHSGEKGRQRRSRVAQRLNGRHRVRFA